MAAAIAELPGRGTGTPRFRVDDPRQTSDPQWAWRNLAERDAMSTDRMVSETHRLDLPAILLDSGSDEGAVLAQATRQFVA